jgi:hypothetical protein
MAAEPLATRLWLAAQQGCERSVARYVRMADEQDRRQALQVSVCNDHVKVTEILLASFRNCLPGYHLVDTAARCGSVHTLHFLLACFKRNTSAYGKDHGATLQEATTTAFLHAVAHGHLGAVRFLVAQKADVDARFRSGRVALTVTVERGCMVTTRFLLDSKACVEGNPGNVRVRSPLGMAVVKCRVDMVSLLLEHGAATVADRYSQLHEEWSGPLLLACARGYAAPALRLLAHGVGVDVQNRMGRTSLHVASAGGHVDVVRALLAHKANVNHRDCAGDTALLYMIRVREIRATDPTATDLARADLACADRARADLACADLACADLAQADHVHTNPRKYLRVAALLLAFKAHVDQQGDMLPHTALMRDMSGQFVSCMHGSSPAAAAAPNTLRP